MNYDQAISVMQRAPWAIVPETLTAVVDLLRSEPQDGKQTAAGLQALTGGAPGGGRASIRGAVAVLPLHGIITQHRSVFSELLGGTSTDGFGQEFMRVVRDPSVATVIIDVDSPGGSVYGLEELAGEIYAARRRKRLIAIANSRMASGAYWIGTAAAELVVTPGGEVGSIGIVAAHTDVSEAKRMAGATPLCSAGCYQAEAMPHQPSGDPARAAIQADVESWYASFISAVARHRGVRPADVRHGFAGGRVVRDDEVVRLGMADRVATLEDTIEQYGGSMQQSSRTHIRSWHPVAG